MSAFLVSSCAIAVIVIFYLVLRRFDGSDEPRRKTPRAWRQMLGCVRRRAGTTFAHARDWARAEWDGLGDTGLPDGSGPEPSPAPVRQPALPNRGDAQEREGGCAPPESRPAAGADLTGLLSPRQVLQRQDLNQEGPRAASAPPSVATRPPTRLATDAERRWYLTTAERDAAPLDYAPAPPFATVLSPDTLARGIPAVKP